MTTQLRDTEFGHLVRLLTNNKVLQYPDEVDSAKWQAVLAAKVNAHGSSEASQAHPISKAPDGKLENGKETAFVVDWYSPDDSEVRDCTHDSRRRAGCSMD